MSALQITLLKLFLCLFTYLLTYLLIEVSGKLYSTQIKIFSLSYHLHQW